MADFVTTTGKEIVFDMNRMTHGQWRGLFDPKEDAEDSDETVARVAGLTIDELNALPQPEYRRLLSAFFKRAREPLADPNA